MSSLLLFSQAQAEFTAIGDTLTHLNQMLSAPVPVAPPAPMPSTLSSHLPQQQQQQTGFPSFMTVNNQQVSGPPSSIVLQAQSPNGNLDVLSALLTDPNLLANLASVFAPPALVNQAGQQQQQ